MTRRAYRRRLRLLLDRNTIALLASLGAFPDAVEYREPLWAKRALLIKALRDA